MHNADSMTQMWSWYNNWDAGMHNADDMTHERCIMEKIIDPMEWDSKDLEISDF